MYEIAYYALVGFVFSLLFVNFFFRVKVLKLYRYLVEHRVEFTASHMLSQSKLETEILPQYPEHKEVILDFVSKVKLSIYIACGLFMLITIIGLLLKNYG
jgi:hypothetical protein